ncbi:MULTISPECIES: L-threonylcarbamoyladenylate synthase [unclassified Virgibacillus]|uniref:L-threonylcarbamoyladenylate synthase n=1 Tax=unclassified Virgibacillus TaxID=2620237 RepID=UPI0024DE92EC|nr:L-threonylcarbamoyladenylate synthase [Virgibacillus sp. LDC-1]
METKRWNIRNEQEKTIEQIKAAAKLLEEGYTVAFPTETVYGLGADATNEQAVKEIFMAKGRPQDNPLIAHVATKEQLMKLVENVPAYVDKLIEAFSPGPLTYVLPSNGTCATNVTAGLQSVGVRIPSHPVAQKLLQIVQVPLAAPSANLSGKPSPTTAEHVWEDLSGRIAGIIDGGPTGVGLESTVVDCTSDIPIILRPGGITKEELEEIVGPVMVDPALMNKEDQPKAPGMKYKHYSPDVPLWLYSGGLRKIQEAVKAEQKLGKRVGVMADTDMATQLDADHVIALGDDLGDIASHLYDALRTFKEENVDVIICQTFSDKGIGEAIMNRLQKAATKWIK